MSCPTPYPLLASRVVFEGNGCAVLVPSCCAESEADSEQLAEERRDEFFREISDTVKSRLAEELEVDKLILEVKSLKLSCEPGHIWHQGTRHALLS